MSRLEQELSVDQKLSDEDAGPPTQPECVESRDPEADWRPDRGDGRRVSERLTELGRAEVGSSERDDAEGVATGRPPKRRRRRVCS